MRQRQSNSTHHFLHVQRFMPSRGACLSAAGQGRAGEYNPSPSWLWQCLRLSASHSLARVPNLFEPLVSRQSLQPQLLLSTILKWALAQESWQSCMQTRHVW